MGLPQLLKTTNSRISIGNTWLYYDNLTNEWVVLEHRYERHKSDTLYRGTNLKRAIEIMKGEG